MRRCCHLWGCCCIHLFPCSISTSLLFFFLCFQNGATHRPEPPSAFICQNTHMQMRWRPRCYLEAIMFPSLITVSSTMTKPFLPLSISLNESTNTLRGKLGHDKVRMFQQRSNQQKWWDDEIILWTGISGLRLSHQDAWLEFGTISFGQNFFHEIVGAVIRLSTFPSIRKSLKLF